MRAAGLSMGRTKSVSREVLVHAREQVGAEAVDETVVAIPGLLQFM